MALPERNCCPSGWAWWPSTDTLGAQVLQLQSAAWPTITTFLDGPHPGTKEEVYSPAIWAQHSTSLTACLRPRTPLVSAEADMTATCLGFFVVRSCCYPSLAQTVMPGDSAVKASYPCQSLLLGEPNLQCDLDKTKFALQRVFKMETGFLPLRSTLPCPSPFIRLFLYASDIHSTLATPFKGVLEV